ncbi:MAG: thiamine pyrophosphate-dependent enzyme [Actinomycetota bacterium]|nr:thiamine pyrophosphate-dependent enzyme [Actinomycetota bacterium]
MAARWAVAEAAAQRVLQDRLDDRSELTEPVVARTVLGATPSDHAVVLASSMPVRDVEWFSAPRRDHPVVLVNRGANGIDGVVSTAMGVAMSGRPVVALVGDLAFLHDLTAWVRPAGTGEPGCTVVVVDNGGGGIFSFLPQAGALAPETFAALFATPQAVDVAAAARGLGVATTEVSDAAHLAVLLGGSGDVPAAAHGLRVLVVRAPDHRANVRIHGELEAAVTEAVEHALSS